MIGSGPAFAIDAVERTGFEWEQIDAQRSTQSSGEYWSEYMCHDGVFDKQFERYWVFALVDQEIDE